MLYSVWRMGGWTSREYVPASSQKFILVRNWIRESFKDFTNQFWEFNYHHGKLDPEPNLPQHIHTSIHGCELSTSRLEFGTWPHPHDCVDNSIDTALTWKYVNIDLGIKNIPVLMASIVFLGWSACSYPKITTKSHPIVKGREGRQVVETNLGKRILDYPSFPFMAVWLARSHSLHGHTVFPKQLAPILLQTLLSRLHHTMETSLTFI